MFKYIAIILLALALTGCAGHGSIKKYKIVEVTVEEEVDGKMVEVKEQKKVLTELWEFEGRNIKAETADGAKIETKGLEIPKFPSTFIGR